MAQLQGSGFRVVFGLQGRVVGHRRPQWVFGDVAA